MKTTKMRMGRGGAATLMVLALLPSRALAQKLDKDDKQFLEAVRPIILPEEEKLFKSLKQKADREEFQKIFWARRDSDLAAPGNEFKESYEKARAEADATFRLPAVEGSNTDCGRTLILLGKPDEVRKEGVGSRGLREPETWTYHDRPGQSFQGGQAVISFDAECRAPAGFMTQLERVAAAKVVQPNLDYRTGKDGRLVPLADLLPRDTPVRALIKTPRKDFDVAARAFYLKVADGGTVAVGLVSGDASSLAVAGDAVDVDVAASAEGEDGREAAWAEQVTRAPVGKDGRFVASFKLGLKPGKYTLKAGAVEKKSGKGALASIPIEVPDLSRVEQSPDGSTRTVPSAASVMILRDVEEVKEGAPADPQNPYAAFSLGQARLLPYFQTSFHPDDQLLIFYQVYDLAVDPATGSADAVATISILRDGKTPVARSPNTIKTPVGGSIIGPVPLAQYSPAKYVVQLKVNDHVAKKEIVEETPFEVVAP